VSVRDLTEVGGPAETVAERELPGIEVPASGTDLPFELDAELDPGRTYAVRAHAGRGDSRSVEAGDLVSTTAHVVGPSYQSGLVVPLQVVGGG
jgi:hypothetical protein